MQQEELVNTQTVLIKYNNIQYYIVNNNNNCKHSTVC
jgi:hypothetical protein